MAKKTQSVKDLLDKHVPGNDLCRLCQRNKWTRRVWFRGEYFSVCSACNERVSIGVDPRTDRAI